MFKGEKKVLKTLKENCKVWKIIKNIEKWNRNNTTEKYKTKIMSSINGYKNSLDMDEEIISEVEDKTEENIYEQHRIKQKTQKLRLEGKYSKIEH